MRASACTRFITSRGCRTAQHDGTALTCENTTNRSQTTQGVTDPVLLLICGFGVQVPGGAPCLTWPYAVSSPMPELRQRARACKCVQKVSAARTHRTPCAGICGREARRAVHHDTS